MFGALAGSLFSSIAASAASKGMDKLFDDDKIPGTDFGTSPMKLGEGNPTSIPGPMEDFGKALMDWGGQQTSNIGTSIMNRGTTKLAEAIFEDSPRKAGAKEGEHKRAMMDAAFPGTTPWERIGSPAGGGSSIPAKEAGKQARETMAHQKDLVSMQIEGQKDVARIAAGPGHREATIKEYLKKANWEKLFQESRLLRQQVRNKYLESKWINKLNRSIQNLNDQQAKKALQEALHTKNENTILKAMMKEMERLINARFSELEYGHFKGMKKIFGEYTDTMENTGKEDWSAIFNQVLQDIENIWNNLPNWQGPKWTQPKTSTPNRSHYIEDIHEDMEIGKKFKK